jgi:hypothetical protein
MNGIASSSLGIRDLYFSGAEAPIKQASQGSSREFDDFMTSTGASGSTTPVSHESDSVVLSTYTSDPDVALNAQPVAGNTVDISDTLTSADKALVTAATGGLSVIGPSGVRQVNQLAVTIALDRSMGNLKGPVTASYLEGLRNDEQQTLALNRQEASNLTANGENEEAEQLAAQGPGISFGVLDKALEFLGQQSAT